jgi:uncharacterized protein involved in propanediol utilization
MRGEARVAGHFGEWLQGRLGPEGPVVLVTLPCPVLAAFVSWRPERVQTVGGADPGVLPAEVALRLLRELGLPEGEITVTTDMPAGGGAGASTAALVALARAAGGASVAPERVAAACIAAEGASDPLMLDFPDRHLWASREGRSLAALPALPQFEIVGGFFGPPIRTDPSDQCLPDIADLIEPWRRAARAGDSAALARLASVSADRTSALRGPAEDPTPRLAVECGALGHVRGHTGSARGLVFSPGVAPAQVERLLTAAGFAQVLRFRTGGA